MAAGIDDIAIYIPRLYLDAVILLRRGD